MLCDGQVLGNDSENTIIACLDWFSTCIGIIICFDGIWQIFLSMHSMYVLYQFMHSLGTKAMVLASLAPCSLFCVTPCGFIGTLLKKKTGGDTQKKQWDAITVINNNYSNKMLMIITTVIKNLLNNINIQYWLKCLVYRIFFLNKCILLFSLDALNWSKITIKIFVMISISNECSSLNFLSFKESWKK